VTVRSEIAENGRKETTIITETNKTAENWKEADVEHWLNEKKVHPAIRANVFPSNGEVLYQLYRMLTDAPEFFYRSITSHSEGSISTKDVAIFSLELRKIFS
jgi:hypothetical protein